MADERPQDLAARVVAWHNRHPLARRITLQQVHAMGWVALPFRAPADAPAAAAAVPRDAAGAAAAAPADAAAPIAPRRGWRPAFTEDFIAPLAPGRVARFAARHGTAAAPHDGLPVRQVRIALPLTAEGAAATLWLETAAIELGARRVRVLVAPLHAPRAIGPRLWSRPRSAAAAAASALALASVAALVLAPASAPAPAAIRASAAASAATAVSATASSATAALAMAASAADASAASTTATAAAPATAGAAATAAMATARSTAGRALVPNAPAALPGLSGREAVVAAVGATQHAPHGARSSAAEPTRAPRALGGAAPSAAPGAKPPSLPTRRKLPDYGVRPHLAPALNETAKAQARALLAAARQARSADRATQGAAAGAAPVPAAAEPTAPPPPSAWALSTRSLRTRFESEQVLVAMRDVAARAAQAAALRYEVLPVGSDWRAVSWPYADRRDAERLRAELLARGLRVEVVPF